MTKLTKKELKAKRNEMTIGLKIIKKFSINNVRNALKSVLKYTIGRIKKYCSSDTVGMIKLLIERMLSWVRKLTTGPKKQRSKPGVV